MNEEPRLALIGEDTEDLLVALRQSFWVEFDRNDIIECCTLGQLFDRVLSKMGPTGEPRCITTAAFYRLRRLLAEDNRMGHRSIKPDTPLQSLVRWRIRRMVWARIKTKLRVTLPPLQPSGSLLVGSLVLALAIALSVTLPGHQPGLWNLLGAALETLLWTLLTWVLCLIVTSPLHRTFPENIQTVGDLARAIARRNHAKMAAEVGGSTVNQAWHSFQELVGSASGIPPGKITREMRFPQDLKIY